MLQEETSFSREARCWEVNREVQRRGSVQSQVGFSELSCARRRRRVIVLRLPGVQAANVAFA